MRLVPAVLLLPLLFLTGSCSRTASPLGGPQTDPHPARIEDGHLFPMIGYQQQTDWTCGPAVCLMIERHYFPDSTLTEAQIATLAGCTEAQGTDLAGMMRFFSRPGWTVQVREGTPLEAVLRAIDQEVPTVVAWSDWGGHWCIPVGYDYRTGKDVCWQDDLIIFRDPYDRVDGRPDGYTDFSLSRFLDMWEEHNYITPGRKNTHLLLVPVPSRPKAHAEAALRARDLLTATR